MRGSINIYLTTRLLYINDWQQRDKKEQYKNDNVLHANEFQFPPLIVSNFQTLLIFLFYQSHPEI